MSILLDALKKSETQRQLGKTPTIHTAVDVPGVQRATEQQWIPLSMLALSAVAIAWFGWQQFREPVTAPDQAGVDVAAMPRVAETPAAETQVPAEKAQRGRNNHTANVSLWNAKKDLTGAAILPANSPEEARERREKLSQSFNSYEAEKETVTDKEEELSSATVAKTSSGTAIVAKTPSGPATIAKTASDPLAKQSPVVEEAPVATPSRRSSRMQPHQSEPISFWQIPQALRDGLPEFRINVLVYAEKQEDRFLLINGQRLVEKEELTDGVVLDEIRRDGAVFLYRNYRFLVKG